MTRANICSIYSECVFVGGQQRAEVNLSPIKGRWAGGAKVQLMFWESEKACGEPEVRRWAESKPEIQGIKINR